MQLYITFPKELQKNTIFAPVKGLMDMAKKFIQLEIQMEGKLQ